MRKLLSVILSITMLLSMATVAFADGVNGPMEKAKLTVGINAEFFPFEYYEGEELKGFDIDLMNYIGERIGFDIEFVNMSFDKLIPAVINGEVDCAISAITVTEEREKVIDFTTPYIAAGVLGEYENYAIVFPESYKEKTKVAEAAGQEFIYGLVDKAIKKLIDDATVEKLYEKYEIEKHFVVDDEETTSVDTAISETNDTTSAITVPAPSDWAKESIDIANSVGITYKTQPYYYHNNITREEFCEMIYNLVVLVSPDIEYFIPDSFTDTKNEKVLKLNSLGIINGKTATEFAPNDYLTREEAATIIIRMVNKIVPMAATEMWFEYDDINEISEWASDSIQTISNLGFMNGIGNNKFAPKETYTTEQAIATLVRVYERAEAAGEIDNSSIGIIGGADGPTSIIVGGNTTVIEDEDYNNFYAKVTKNTTKVDDFYVDEAIKLITESGKLAADRDFISLYTTNDEMTNKLLALGAVDFNKPTDIFYLSSNREQIKANIEALAEAEGVDIEDMGDFWFEHILKRLNFSTLASLINASYGAENLAALTILTNSRGYIMPKDFKNDFALYFEYDEGCSALVTFSEFGDGVISANMSFVINGDKDNIFRRVFELTEGLGEDSIEMALVK